MKKLMVLALGLGIALGSVSFAQTPDDSKGTDMGKKKRKKGGKKTTDMTTPPAAVAAK